MNYNYILNYEDFKKELLRSNKEYFTRKDGIPKPIIDCIFSPTKKEKVIINIHLPETTNKDNDYIPIELFEKYHNNAYDNYDNYCQS